MIVKVFKNEAQRYTFSFPTEIVFYFENNFLKKAGVSSA